MPESTLFYGNILQKFKAFCGGSIHHFQNPAEVMERMKILETYTELEVTVNKLYGDILPKVSKGACTLDGLIAYG